MTGLTQHCLRTFGFVCVIAGLLTFPTPLPSGIPLMTLGMVVLLTNSRLAPIWLRALRRRSTVADGLVSRLEHSAPGRWRNVLRRTRRYRRRRPAP